MQIFKSFGPLGAELQTPPCSRTWTLLPAFWLEKTTYELHISNLHVKTQLLIYGKGGFFIFEFPTQVGGLRTIRKTELEENKGILKNPLYTLHKGPKRHI